MQTRLCFNSSSSSTVNVAPEKVLRLFGVNIRISNDSVDSELWHACAGKMVKLPAINSIVYYFPQGHAEHAHYPVDNLLMINPPPPTHVLCRVDSLKLMANPKTDEVFTKIRLVPIQYQSPGLDRLIEKEINVSRNEAFGSSASFAKTLTPSDTNISGCFTMPKEGALTVFPNLNYQEDPPVQRICCTDVHGEMWTFRHVFRGSPKRHLLNEGWSKFAVQKKLVAGDSIVFVKKENGEIHVGIRRRKGGAEHNRRRRIREESVIEAMRLASSGQAFEVEYYPGTGTFEYCVKAELVREATLIPWCPGMIVKIAVESDDHSRISWFMGTITGVEGNLIWKQLEVRWEKARGLLEDVKRVNRWTVEPVSSMPMPPLHLDSAADLSPPAKKICLPTYDHSSTIPPLITTGHQLQLLLPQLHCSAFSGIQGSRHIDYKLHDSSNDDDDVVKDDISCVLTIGDGHADATTANDSCDAKKESTAIFRLFGHTIVVNTEREQKSDISSSGNDRK